MLDLTFGTKFKVAPKFEHKLYIPINKDLKKLHMTAVLDKDDNLL